MINESWYNIFAATPFIARPGPMVANGGVDTPAFNPGRPTEPQGSPAPFVAKIDTTGDWNNLLNPPLNLHLYRRASINGQTPVISNGVLYGVISPGYNSNISGLVGLWNVADANGISGYAQIVMARMVMWHPNYRPSDSASLNINNPSSTLLFSGKSPGVYCSATNNISSIDEARGGIVATGLGGFSCRSQRGSAGFIHLTAQQQSKYLPFGDYDYALTGNTNGATRYGSVPIPRGEWLWIVTKHAVNTVNPDGTWAADGVYELWVNGRKYCESRALEYRTGGNSFKWNGVWFDEYNGGTNANFPDRPWPFAIGPTYVMAGNGYINPPANFAAQFPDVNGIPSGSMISYNPEYDVQGI